MTSMPSPSIFSGEAIADNAASANHTTSPDPNPVPTWIPASNQALSDEITRLAGHINAAQYRFLKLFAVLVERKAWGGDSGMKSPAHWLNYFCGIDMGAAREKVRVAKCLASLPLIDQAFASGAISYSKVRAMTRTATPDNEEYLLMIARHGTANMLKLWSDKPNGRNACARAVKVKAHAANMRYVSSPTTMMTMACWSSKASWPLRTLRYF
ncbi:MAG: hypothetical protein O2971_19535 [Proteobacteria bacterium]|nr:hypothetical protein [Pseudomonadota bacterium]